MTWLLSMMINADIFGLLYSIQYASCKSQGYMMSHHMVFKNFSLHGIPTKLFLQLHSHPTHLALLVELLTVSLIHEPNQLYAGHKFTPRHIHEPRLTADFSHRSCPSLERTDHEKRREDVWVLAWMKENWIRHWQQYHFIRDSGKDTLWKDR